MAVNLSRFSNPRYHGGRGFGQGAYDRARASGLTDAQIQAALPSSGLTQGNFTWSGGSKTKGTNNYANMSQFSNPDWGSGRGFGRGAYDRARAAGYSDFDIKKGLPTSGLEISPTIAKMLGANTDLYQYRGSGKQFGMGTLNNARNAGLTDAEIRRSLASSGLQISPDAARSINVNPGYTYLGRAANVRSGFRGNSGRMYESRPQLAPAGYGLDKSKGYANPDGIAAGFAPTFYIAGGMNDYDAANYIFRTNALNASNTGGGYSDPTFHLDNAGFVGKGMAGLGGLNSSKMQQQQQQQLPSYQPSSFQIGLNMGNQGPSGVSKSTASVRQNAYNRSFNPIMSTLGISI